MRVLGNGWQILCFLGCAAPALAATTTDAGDPLKLFVNAMVGGQTATMRALVHAHQERLAEDVFGLLRESASLLKKSEGKGDAVLNAATAVLVASKLAETFADALPGANVLVTQFGGSLDKLTARARVRATSDLRLGFFLGDCAKKVATRTDLAAIAADLDSIVQAAGESPEDQARRLLEEQMAEARKEREEREERERVARLCARVDRLQEKRDVAGLLDILDDASGDARLRLMAIEVVGKLRAPEAVGDLSRHLGEEPLQKAILTALGQIGGEGAAKVLIARLGDESLGEHAADALAAAWGDRAAAEFRRLVRQGPAEAPARRAAVRALGRLGKPEAVDDLLGLVDNKDVQAAAIEALGRIGGDRAIEALVRQLDDASAGEVARKALSGLGAAAIPALVGRLRQAPMSAGMRRAALLLAEAGYRPATSAARARMLLAQGRSLGLLWLGPRAVPALLSGLRSSDAGVRGTAATALAVEVLGVGLPLLALFLWLRRKWLFPDVKVQVTPGDWAQWPQKLRILPEDREAEPGTILRTKWARSRLGRRQRIKVETFVGEKATSERVPEEDDVRTEFRRRIRAAWLSEPSPSTPTGFRDRLGALWRRIRRKELGPRQDLLVSVGASVRPGTYLAEGPDGIVRIRVRRPRNQP